LSILFGDRGSLQSRLQLILFVGLMEIDLETLSTVGHERFPFSITALSEAKHPVPLTVGTNLSLYLHDSRKRSSTSHGSSGEEKLDSYDAQFGSLQNQGSLNFRSLLNPEPSPDYVCFVFPPLLYEVPLARLTSIFRPIYTNRGL
jgi:hypothetical protein